jgi:hypothetical protein
VRWTYKAEMELLLRAADFARYEICGGFDRRPLTQETDQLVVLAWAGPRELAETIPGRSLIDSPC